MNRLYNLDYLRGLAAAGVMVFHYLSWTFGAYEADSVIGRIGIYGVSTFYVLSGLTLYHVYHQKLVPEVSSIIAFIKKRILRIFPLLWLATIITVVLSHGDISPFALLLNLSGLFSIYNWHQYYAIGAWSIGNELFFYSFFIVFIFLRRWSKFAFAVLAILILASYLNFAFAILHKDQPLVAQWKNYTNPLNQLLLFLGGFSIGWSFQNVRIPAAVNFLLLFGGIGVFIFYPASGDTIHLVTGINRLVFTFCCIVVCLSFYKTSFKLPSFFDKPLTKLGEASYSVYMLHPIVFSIVTFVFSHGVNRVVTTPVYVKPVVAGILSLLISYLVYMRFEKYFMKLGHPHTQKPVQLAGAAIKAN